MTSSDTESRSSNPQHENNYTDTHTQNGNTPLSDEKLAIIKKTDLVVDGKVSKVKLAHAGCLTCRHRHKKCTRERPVCYTCSKSGYNCFWREPGTRFTDYKVKLVRASNPRGTILQPNPSSSDNILSSQYHLSDQEMDDSLLINNSTENDSNILGDDSLLSVAQKAVSITNAYMNSQEMQVTLKRDPEEEIEQMEVKLQNDESAKVDEKEKKASATKLGKGKTKEEGKDSEEQEHENDEEENNESEDEESPHSGYKKDGDSEDEDENGSSNGNYNEKSNTPEGESSSKGNDKETSSSSDDVNHSSQHRNTAINSTQDLDTLKLLKFKTLLDTNQNNNIIINEGTLINFPSDNKSNSISKWYTRYLSSTPDPLSDSPSDDEELDSPDFFDDALASLEPSKKVQNKDVLSPALFLSHVANERMLERYHPSFDRVFDNSMTDYEVQLETIEPKSKALVTTRVRRVHRKHVHRRSGKLNGKTVSKEMGAKLLLASITKSKKNFDKCKIYQDGRRKRSTNETHVDLSELPSYITQFLKQP